MNLNKQFINIIGAVVIVAILVAGVALIALPMWSQAQATDADTRTIAQTNSMYQTQIDQLQAAEARIDEIDAHIAELRAEIAPFTRLDDAFDLIVKAAEKHELVLETVTAADPEPFTPRTGIPTEGAAAPASDAAGEETDGGTAGAAAEPSPVGGSSGSAQQQVLITITVPVADAESATAFVDDLRVGPRLIAVTDVTFDTAKLTVTALAFIRTED